MSGYRDFLATKSMTVKPSGIDVASSSIHPRERMFQCETIRWQLRKGRAACFAATGLGKAGMAIESCRLTGERSLIIAPLGVVRQFVDEGERLGVEVIAARQQSDASGAGITVTNYDRLHLFNLDAFRTVALDESAILRNFAGKTRAHLTEACRDIPYRFAYTAVAAPNDIAELANHAEFLGICTRGEMLATWFVNANKSKATGNKADTGQEYMLRGHARESFFKWLSSWAMSIKRPSDLGDTDDGYILPELSIRPVIIPTDYVPEGQLFATGLKGITDRARVRKSTVAERVAAAVRLIEAEPDQQWIVWAGLNAEQDAIATALGDRCVSVTGSMDPDDKITGAERWRRGDVPVLVTKVSIFGQGMNFQNCARMAFVGLSDSFADYHQAIRRCWRFGQDRPVHAYVVLTDLEEPIYRNVLRKEREFEHMTSELVKYVGDFQRAEIGQQRHREDLVHAQPIRLPAWLGVAS